MTDTLLEEIESELAKYKEFDTNTKEGIQRYLDSIRVDLPKDEAIESIYMKEDMNAPDSNKIRLVFCETAEQRRIWQYVRIAVSRLPYAKASGRNISILTYYEDKLLGVIGLSSPVPNLTPRDKYLPLGLAVGNSKGKGYKLLSILDMTTCVGVQPWAGRHNGGKLLAALATSKEVVAYYKNKYPSHGADNYTSKEVFERIDLKWITTTSIYGESIQYDRLYKYLGLSAGIGHIHIPPTTYNKMLKWLEPYMSQLSKGQIGTRFGDGSSPKMRRIRTFLKLSGLNKKFNLKHNQRRGVYSHPVQDRTASEIFAWWYYRWCKPRLDRLEGVREQVKQ